MHRVEKWLKKIYFLTFFVVFVFLAGCGRKSNENDLKDSRESGGAEEMSEKYGVFVDTQGTDSVFSSLVTRRGEDGQDEAVISIYRQGVAEGSFADNGNGELVFSAYDGSVEGIIIINGQAGASFRVTETSGETPFSVGEIFEFPTDGNRVGE